MEDGVTAVLEATGVEGVTGVRGGIGVVDTVSEKKNFFNIKIIIIKSFEI